MEAVVFFEFRNPLQKGTFLATLHAVSAREEPTSNAASLLWPLEATHNLAG